MHTISVPKSTEQAIKEVQMAFLDAERCIVTINKIVKNYEDSKQTELLAKAREFNQILINIESLAPKLDGIFLPEEMVHLLCQGESKKEYY